ncbi:MAG: type II toxin-antitoxin system HicA family toxin [Acidobacteria bacterium]|nr:type II toxin-antitoxin system HicA family toxin [Acidobacteriota bacterium]
MATQCLRAFSKRSLRLSADEVAGGFWRQAVKAFRKVGYEFDEQHGSHMILRYAGPPHRRLSVPNHKELAKGTLRALIREAGLTVEEFAQLL